MGTFCRRAARIMKLPPPPLPPARWPSKLCLPSLALRNKALFPQDRKAPWVLRSRGLVILPSRGPVILPSRGPVILRSRGPVILRSRGPVKLPSRGPVKPLSPAQCWPRTPAQGYCPTPACNIGSRRPRCSFFRGRRRYFCAAAAGPYAARLRRARDAKKL